MPLIDSQTIATKANLKFIRPLYLLQRLIRLPNLLIIVAAQYLTRIFLVGPSSAWKQHLANMDFFTLSLSTVFIAAAGYVINDYYDVKIDLINKPEKVIVGKQMRRRVAMFFHTLLNFLGIGLGAMISLKVGAINFISTYLLWLYSNKLKRKPFTGNLVISLLTATSILVVGVYYGLNYKIWIFALFSFYISLIREIIKDMEDRRGDMHFGCRTLPIVWGIRKTKIFLYFILGLFVLSMFVLLLLLNNTTLTFYFILMSFPTGYFVDRLYWADTRVAYRFLSIFCKLLMLSGLLMMIFI